MINNEKQGVKLNQGGEMIIMVKTCQQASKASPVFLKKNLLLISLYHGLLKNMFLTATVLHF